ncbi:MAG: four helix bundle protein [Verrucomicrobiota bacterium]
MQDFRRLAVWQKAHPLVLDIYRATKSFPSEEKYGLSSQIRRASSSIPMNIWTWKPGSRKSEEC